MKSLAIVSSAVLTVFMASTSWAISNSKTVCSHTNQQRVIEVVYPTKSALPCEVRYSKPAGTQVLWSAQNETGYCEQKAAQFVKKQKSWGWNCQTATSEQ